MAMTEFRWELGVTFADSGNNYAPRTYQADYATFADFDAFSAGCDALVSQLELLTDCEIVAQSRKLILLEDAVTLPTNTQVENQGFFSGKIDVDPTQSAVLSLPALKNTFYVSATGKGNNVVNVGNSTVAAFLNQFDTGSNWTLSDGQHWDSTTVAGRRRHVKNSNG